MLGNRQFYHETVRNIIVGFGTLFNDIHVVRKNNSGVITQSMKVPLAYGPKQKFLVRLDQDSARSAENPATTALTLPRIGFEMTTLQYDPTRKLNRVQKFKKTKTGDSNQLETQFMPVPYNLGFQLYILSKNSDDALQIVEQILPFFQPDYTLTINDMPEMSSKRDVPVVLNSISYEDDYEGDFATRRAIIYTLDFTAKFYLYGPVTSCKVIKTVQVDQYTDVEVNSPKREQRLTVTPNPTTVIGLPDSDFGFDTTIELARDSV